MRGEPLNRLRVFPALETARLRLREITAADAGWYLLHFSRPEVAHGQGVAPPADLAAARAELDEYILGKFADRTGLRWGLVLKEGGALHEAGSLREGGALIGSVGFYDYDAEVRSMEIGYDLDPAFWGRGLMTEALTTILDFAFERLDVNRAQAIAMPRNRASRRLLERLGFTREGVLREHGHDETGALVDDVMYSLLRREWRANRRAGS